MIVLCKFNFIMTKVVLVFQTSASAIQNRLFISDKF